MKSFGSTALHGWSSVALGLELMTHQPRVRDHDDGHETRDHNNWAIDGNNTNVYLNLSPPTYNSFREPCGPSSPYVKKKMEAKMAVTASSNASEMTYNIFKQNGAPFLLTTLNKSASRIKEIILDARFPKWKSATTLQPEVDEGEVMEHGAYEILQPRLITRSSPKVVIWDRFTGLA
ncbi:hypothetical protein TNCV_4389111 [Trichonephila clavipes]|nr:hypothetical protein TNCV_4389111 [Trichonephila clavipes]